MTDFSIEQISDAISTLKNASGREDVPFLITPPIPKTKIKKIGSVLGIEVYTRDDIADGAWYLTYDKRMRSE